MKPANRKAMFAKMHKLENFLVHARTQEIPIARKEDQLLRLKDKLGLANKLNDDDKKILEQLKKKPSERSMWHR